VIKSCLGCSTEKPITNFACYNEKSTGKVRYKARCKACNAEDRRRREGARPRSVPNGATKTCVDCGETKALTAFRSRGGDTPHLLKSFCNTCLYERHRKWAANNADRVAEYREKDPWTLAKRCSRRGITPEQLVDRYERQEGCCAICKTEVALMESAIDHNHATGEFRGVLCKQCNRALGMFGDSLSTLKNAVEYLESFGSYGDGT
jgi:hypothetical protein